MCPTRLTVRLTAHCCKDCSTGPSFELKDRRAEVSVPVLCLQPGKNQHGGPERKLTFQEMRPQHNHLVISQGFLEKTNQ